MATRINNYHQNYLSANSAFTSLFKHIMQYGFEINGTKEIINVSINIYNVQDITFASKRNFNKAYAEYEYQWYKSGNRNAMEIAKRASMWGKIADDQGNVNSNYGYHWLQNDQLKKITEMIRQNYTTRRAVILHYDYNKMDEYSKDTPCNIALNFHWDVGGRLCLTIFARSIDLVYGFCNDIYCFSRLLTEVSESLFLLPGDIHYFITNLHIYERHYKLLE
jgi:thymidylate synthase